MKCPVCGCEDLRDLGWVRSRHVLVCRAKDCGATLEAVTTMVVLADRKTKRSLR